MFLYLRKRDSERERERERERALSVTTVSPSAECVCHREKSCYRFIFVFMAIINVLCDLIIGIYKSTTTNGDMSHTPVANTPFLHLISKREKISKL